MAEMCEIVNAHPIVSVSSDSEYNLSPAVLLTQKRGKMIEPFDNLGSKDLYRTQWKQDQTIAENFKKKLND